MVVIVEGFDKAGKSTLCEGLSRELDLKVYRVTRPSKFFDDSEFKPFLYGELTGVVNLLEIFSIQQVVFDRFHLTEFAYSLAFSSELDTSFLRKIDERLSKLNSFLILLESSRPLDLGESEILGEKQDEIKFLFRKLFLNSRIRRKLFLQTDEISPESTLERVISFLKGEARDASQSY